MITINLSEEQRQSVLMALANLAIDHPGWNEDLAEIALLMDNPDHERRPAMFEQFKEFRSAANRRVV